MARVANVLRIQPRLVHDRAVLEKDDAVGIRGNVRVVRHHHRRASGPQG